MNLCQASVAITFTIVLFLSCSRIDVHFVSKKLSGIHACKHQSVGKTFLKFRILICSISDNGDIKYSLNMGIPNSRIMIIEWIVNKRLNLLCTSNNMVLGSLVYIAMVIIVIIVIIILLRFLFGVLFIIPSSILDPVNMLLLPETHSFIQIRY